MAYEAREGGNGGKGEAFGFIKDVHAGAVREALDEAAAASQTANVHLEPGCGKSTANIDNTVFHSTCIERMDDMEDAERGHGEKFEIRNQKFQGLADLLSERGLEEEAGGGPETEEWRLV